MQAFCEWTEGDERQLRQAIVACRRRVRHMSHVSEALIPTWHRMLQSHTMAVAMLHATNEALASDDSVSVAHAPFEPSVFSIRLALSQKWNVSVCDWVETFPLHDADNFLTRALRAARAYLLPVTRHTMLSSLLSATTSRRRHRRMVVLSNWLAETATTANLDTMIASPSFFVQAFGQLYNLPSEAWRGVSDASQAKVFDVRFEYVATPPSHSIA